MSLDTETYVLVSFLVSKAYTWFTEEDSILYQTSKNRTGQIARKGVKNIAYGKIIGIIS